MVLAKVAELEDAQRDTFIPLGKRNKEITICI